MNPFKDICVWVKRYIPRRYHPFGVDHPLPGHIVVIEAGGCVGGKVLEADADLAGALC